MSWKMQQEGNFKYLTRVPHSYRTQRKFTKLAIKAAKADPVPEEEAATEEAEDIAQALKRTCVETVEICSI